MIEYTLRQRIVVGVWTNYGGN